MTLANKITILRILMIPVMIVVISVDAWATPTNFLGMYLNQLIFACLFVVASFTDFLDGYIARKRNEITTFGKFLDPIADKMLTFTALLYLMFLMPDRVKVWMVAVILIREFAVTGARLLAVEKGEVIPASIFGKIKTISTMIAIIVLLFGDFYMPELVGEIILYFAVLATIVSGVDYIWKSRKIIFETK